MKKIKILLLALLMVLPLGVKAATKEPVKVYMFEAGGCPFCEQEQDYLEGLEGYNTKFVIVKKQLYVDHGTWAHGEDYNLGVKVAKAFNKAGFKNADYQGTPFVVISDLYAATGYDNSLETYINQAYEEGDKDIVTCISEGKEGCLPEKAGLSLSPKALAIIGVSVVLVIGAIVVLNYQFNKVVEAKPEDKEKKNEPKKEETKEIKVSEETKKEEKKETSKKASTKTTTPKSNASKTKKKSTTNKAKK